MFSGMTASRYLFCLSITVFELSFTDGRSVCPEFVCGDNYCPSEYAPDINGCSTCQCIDPCENAGIICNATQRCNVAPNPDPHIQEIDPVLECVPRCPEVGCARFCKSGFVLKNGCPTCQCIDPCEDAGIFCNATQRCNVVPNSDPHIQEIDPVHRCVPVCPEVGCARFCKSGFVLKNGCPTCQCIDPCEDAGIFCNATQRCNVVPNSDPHIQEIDPVLGCVPVCPEVGCARFCKSGFVLKNGCPTCQCIDPCEDAGIFCNATQRCNVTQNSEPHIQEIDPVLGCVPRCPEKKCAKDCGFYGYALDSNNCQTCQCIDPCENAGIICNATQRCKEPLMVGVEGASSPDFNLEPECIPRCPEWKCAKYCESGYALDSNGCATCQCISPCENAGIICNATQRCNETQISDPHAPELDPQLECVPLPQCGPACDIVCEYGHVLDENDCQTCECKDPCKDIFCLEPKVCVPRPVFCFLASCYPVPTCCTPFLSCNLSCPNGYAIDSDGCQICQCKQILSTRAP